MPTSFLPSVELQNLLPRWGKEQRGEREDVSLGLSAASPVVGAQLFRDGGLLIVRHLRAGASSLSAWQ